MKTIYKYSIHPDNPRLEVALPEGALVVFVGSQLTGVVNFWIEFTPDEKTYQRTFVLYGTGHDIPTNNHYVGSVLDPPFVWHLYEENPLPLDRRSCC